MNVYSSLSGITTNQSEGFNTLLKQYEHWKEAPLDSMILGLNQLQVYHHNEMQRGYGGLVSYSLSPFYSFAAIPLNELVTLSVTSPTDIITKIRSSRDSVNDSLKKDTDTDDIEGQAKDTDSVNKVNDDIETNDDIEINDDIETNETTNHSIDNASAASQFTHAR